MDRARVIERSLRCYRLSWLGLVPVLGVVPAVMALGLFRKVGEESGEQWNPARLYALAGLFIAIFGLLLSLAVGGAITLYCAHRLIG